MTSPALARRLLPLAGALLVTLPAVAATLPATPTGGRLLPDGPTPATALRMPAALAGEPQGLWLGGDSHVHTDHSSDGSGSRQGSDGRLPGNTGNPEQIGQSERVGLDWLPLTDHRTYEQHWDPAWRSSKLLLVPGEEANGAPHATVHGAVDQVVDGGNPAGSAAYRHVQQSVWSVHSQDAHWTTAHPDDGEIASVGPDGTPVGDPDASTVGVDSIEVLNAMDTVEPANAFLKLRYAETRWARGWRTGVVGASDNHFRELWAVAGPGMPTTRVFARERSVGAVLDALRAGRTTVSALPAGPAVTVGADADGDGVFEAMGGDAVATPAGQRLSLRVRALAAPGQVVRVWDRRGHGAAPVARWTVASADETRVVPVDVPAGTGWFLVEIVAPAEDRLLSVASPVFTGPAVAPAPEVPLPEPLGLTDAASSVLGTAGAYTGFPDVAEAGGARWVVAEQHDGGRSSVAVSGPRGTVVVAEKARFPRVAAVSADEAWVVWQDGRAGELPHRPAVYARQSLDGGASWLPEVAVSASSGRAVHPDVALRAGRPVIAWSDNGVTGAFEVLVRELGVDAAPVAVSPPGKTITPGAPEVDSRSPRYATSLFPSLAVLPDGTVAVAWEDSRFDPDPGWTGGTPAPGQEETGTQPDDREVMVSTRPASGVWSAPAVVARSPQTTERHPDLAVAGDGSLVAAWDTRALRASGADPQVRAARSTDGGRTWSAPEPVGVDPAALAERPRLATGSDGLVRAVWSDTRSADWRWSVQTSVLGAGGWSAASRLTGDGNALWPAVSGSSVVFTSDRGAALTRDRTQVVYALPLG